jgi:hypothetical protein
VYTFAASTSTYTDLSGATSLDILENDDTRSENLPLGFTFTFSGQPYTSIVATSNGIVSFSPYAVTLPGSASNENELDETFLAPLLAPLWDDLHGSDGTASYLTTGSTGSKIFTIEFKNWRWYGNTSASISFQIKLYEADGKIEFIYRQEAGSVSGADASIGLAFVDMGQFLSLNNATSGAVASTVTETKTISLRPATGQKFSFTPVKENQTITFTGPLTSKKVGETLDLSATATSGLSVNFISSDLNVVTISGTTATFVGVGTATITAEQAGNSVYNAAPSVGLGIEALKGDQTITFNTLPNKVYGEQFVLTATSSAGVPVTFNSSNQNIATISGNTVTAVGVGTVTITALAAANANFNSATDVSQTLTITKASQTISFTAPSSPKRIGDIFTLVSTATSQLPVTYSTPDDELITIQGSTVTVIGGGDAVIVASQAGNSFYNSATAVEREITILKSQTIFFEQPDDKLVTEGSVQLIVVASSELPVALSSASTNISINSNNVVSLLSAGPATILAEQEGTSEYDVATPVERTFCINPAKPVITESNLTSATPILTSTASEGNQWFKNGVAMSGATTKTLTINDGGVYSVQVNIGGCESELADDVEIVVTGTEKMSSVAIIYPNPVKDLFVVDVTSLQLTNPAEVKMLDLSGREITSWSGNGKIECNVSQYPAGNFMVKIHAGAKIITRQLNKK